MKKPPSIRKRQPNKQYLINLNDEQLGPYDLEEVKLLIEHKNIDGNTLVRKEGMEHWDHLSSLSDLRELLSNEIGVNDKAEEPSEKDFISQKNTFKSQKAGEKLNLMKWAEILGVVTLISSALCLFGSIHQYFQFETSKTQDMSYIGPFTAFGALITVLLSLACSIFLIRYKSSFYKSFFSILIGVGAFLLLLLSESNYRTFWQPFWDAHLWNCESSGWGPEYSMDNLEKKWIAGEIDETSLKRIKYLIDIHAVPIGSQVWGQHNLSVDKFQNGDPIPQASSYEEWMQAEDNKQPAWCYYNNNPKLGEKYGKLYNWYAVSDKRGLAPKGWHIPSKEEWTGLFNYFGGQENTGSKLKSSFDWPNVSNNESGFNALPGGNRNYGHFVGINEQSSFWSSSEFDLDRAYEYYLPSQGKGLFIDWFKSAGSYVRCIEN